MICHVILLFLYIQFHFNSCFPWKEYILVYVVYAAKCWKIFFLTKKILEDITYSPLSVWSRSKFRDIFDENFFINALHSHVNVIKELPKDVLQRFDNNISKIVNLRVKAWSSPAYYLQKVLPKLLQLGYGFLSIINFGC